MKKISLLLTLTLLLSPLSTLAREVTPSPLVNIYHYTFASTSSTPPMVMSVLPVDEEGSALFVVTPYVGEVATDTLLVLDQELLSFISKIATSTYGYDQNDMRTFLTDGGYTTIFPNMYFSSSTGNTGTTTKYIYAGGLLVSTIEKATSTRYLRYSFADPLQSASVITDATGQTIQETIDYMPYGAVRVDSKSNGYGGTKKGYIQSERDSSGLNYMQSRFENPVQGRFISLDPVSANVGSMSKMPAYLLMMNQSGGTIDQTQLLSDPQLLNFYSYARSNPVTMSDPSGLNPWLFLFLPGQTSFDPLYEPAEYSAQNSIQNKIIGAAIGAVGESGLPQIRINQLNGMAREVQVSKELSKQYPGADILGQRILRNSNGTKAIDPDTGQGRTIDFAVVKNGQVLQRTEVTSLTANKAPQQTKEQNIINRGGTFIRTSNGQLINFANQNGGVTTPATIVRKPRRRRKSKTAKNEIEYERLDTDYWTILIPKDWKEKESKNDGMLYFESLDGRKGFYIMTIDYHTDDPLKIKEILQSFSSIGSSTLRDMEDYKWVQLSEEELSLNGVNQFIVDNYDKDNHYRITEKVLTRLPFAVRATFHDYDCAEFSESNLYFAPIINSLQLKDNNKFHVS